MEPVHELVELLEAAELRATMDPAELVPPGVVAQVLSFQTVTMTSWLITTQLLLVVPNSDHDRATTELVELANAVLEVVDPDGPITSRPVLLPNDPVPLPGLVIPVNLTT
jgi:hypothetical protein